MPELPEVETVRLGLLPAFEGARFERIEQRRADLRFPFPRDFVARLTGAKVEALARRAKYLLARLDSGETLVMHLGMSGSFRVDDAAPGAFHHMRGGFERHDHVVFTLSGGARVTYNDPRRFGFMLLVRSGGLAEHPYFRGLGVEPLGEDFDAATLARLLAGKRAPLKAALLDQRLIAGLGNIYVCEALHRAGLSPTLEAGKIVRADGAPSAKAKALATAIPAILREALRAGGSTLRDHRRTDGALGYFQHAFAVYDREGLACVKPGCKGVVARVVQAGRSTFYCRACQR